MAPRRFEVIDLRALQSERPADERARRRYRLGAGGRVLERAPQGVLGIGLHQTAIRFGVTEQQTRAAGGSSIRAKDLRALNVAGHVVVWLYPPGPPRIVLANPFRWHVNHGNALNPFTVGIEVEADLPGQLRRGPFSLTEDQVACVREAIEVVVELGRGEGMPMTHLWAHRQTNGKKPGDPGEELWARTVVDYARPVLGLKTELDRFWPGTTPVTPAGRPIPRAWDPEAKADYQ